MHQDSEERLSADEQYHLLAAANDLVDSIAPSWDRDLQPLKVALQGVQPHLWRTMTRAALYLHAGDKGIHRFKQLTDKKPPV